MHRTIVIKNIYYMLSYVYNKLRTLEYAKLSAENFHSLHDLFATVLHRGILQQIKNGLLRDYSPHCEELSHLRGKISIEESIKQQTMARCKLICSYDEFDENNISNQVIKATLNSLLCSEELSGGNKQNLKQIVLQLSRVSHISLQTVHWHALLSQRVSRAYSYLLSVCYLVYKSLIIYDKQGRLKLESWFSEEQLPSIYEKFVLTYYKVHFPHLSPKSTKIDWNRCDQEDSTYLPKMVSDITLSSKGKSLIIDTKFYTKIMHNSFRSEGKKFISPHLYQLYAYVKNQDKRKNGNVAGVVLYAKTNEDNLPNHTYVMDGSQISLKTLDLNCDWLEITTQLNNLTKWLVD